MALTENLEETPPIQESQIIEDGVRLSQSLIWRLQRNFFEQKGVNAWSQGIVPHYITSNPFIADTYAQVVAGFIEDCRKLPDYTPTERLYFACFDLEVNEEIPIIVGNINNGS